MLRGASRQGRPLTQAQCGYLVAQAANGLGYAHELTDADGNRDFCEDGVNCLMPPPEPQAVSAAIARVLGEAALRDRLVAAGRETAEAHRWTTLAPGLVRFYESIAGTRTQA